MKLLIIDVQQSYMEWISSEDLLSKIEELGKSYSEITYLWDNVSGQDFSDEFPEDWLDSYSFDADNNEVQHPGFFSKISHVIEKNYGFFRDLMESETRSDIVLLGKFLLKHSLYDAFDISQREDIFEKFKEEFKNSPILSINFEDRRFSLPLDLIDELRGLSNCSLVGGARNECLEEVSILLEIADIPHKILEDYCY